MRPWVLYFMLSCCPFVFGQQPSGKIEFEVASIKPSQPLPMGQMRIMMNADAGMLRYSNVSLKDCIRVAYRVKDFQVQGADWIGSTHFDIQAKLPEGLSKDQIPEMLQSLLAERFKLALHRDRKEYPIYALVVAKNGPKLTPAEAPANDEPSANRTPNGAPPRGNMLMQMSSTGMHLKAASATLPNLAEMISRFSERPVVDMTGIQGQYDFDLLFMPERMNGMPGGMPRGMPGGGPQEFSRPGAGSDHPNAVQDTPVEKAGSIYESVGRYGLKLEPRKAPMEILVVDHIEKTPTEN